MFDKVRNYIAQYVALSEDALNVIAIWVVHTWLFSPSCTQPYTTPYLYITAAKGSGKTLLGQDVLGTICRSALPTVGITGPGLIRLVGGSSEDDDTDTVTAMPTLTIDEVDALYSGNKDEVLRMMLNAGYRKGGIVPRVVGKEVINYSAFCPKILMGIDNGHLPDTVLDRSIRIELTQATPEEMLTLTPFYHYEVEDTAADLSQELSSWAIDHSESIKSYSPVAIPNLRPRQWEIARTLVQVAHALGVEDDARDSLEALLTASTSLQADPRVKLYTSIYNLFDRLQADRLTTKQILAQLAVDGISVPGNTGKGLAVTVGKDGAKSSAIRLSSDEVQRGYHRYVFDDAFSRFVNLNNEGEQ